MPTLAFAKQRVGKEMGSRALVADSKETWVCSYLSMTLLLGVGAYAVIGRWWADPVGALAMLPIILGRAGRRWPKRASQPTARTDLMDHWLSAPFDVEMFAGCPWPSSRPRRSFGKTWGRAGQWRRES
jgi:hypothetical protein